MSLRAAVVCAALTALLVWVDVGPASAAQPGFNPTIPLEQARFAHTATSLADGRVLVVGGGLGRTADDDAASAPRVRAAAELWDLAAGTATTVGSLAEARQLHTSTPLDDGRVLITGGWDGDRALASTELWDPVAQTFVAGPAMMAARMFHTATHLADGRVLIVGGATSANGRQTLGTAEVFDPTSGTLTPTGSLAESRAHHSATFLSDGRVLIVGGARGADATPRDDDIRDIEWRATAEVWDPTSGLFSAAGMMDLGRAYHTASTLADGSVLIVGGWPPAPHRAFLRGVGDIEDAALLWDPATSEFRPTGPPVFQRFHHSATSLPDGRVLIAAGDAVGRDGVLFQEVILAAYPEIYDPVSGHFESADPRVDADPFAWPGCGSAPCGRTLHSASLLPGGRVLIAGGMDHAGALGSTELWDPALASPRRAGRLVEPRADHTATLLDDGTVLVVGGRKPPERILASAEVFDPTTRRSEASGRMARPRIGHTATKLLDGRVLVIGGRDRRSTIGGTEIWDPTTRSFSPGPLLLESREGHAAFLLEDGSVLVVGGWDEESLRILAERWEPGAETFAPAGSLSLGRYRDTATLMPDGTVVVAGGLVGDRVTSSIERWDPRRQGFEESGDIAIGRQGHAAAVLAGGDLLLVGGYGEAPSPGEGGVVLPLGERWSPTSATSVLRGPVSGILDPTITPLPDGRVVIVGGEAIGQADVDSPAITIWDDALSGFVPAGALIGRSRHGHTATLLPDGSVLILGGARYANLRERLQPVGERWIP